MKIVGYTLFVLVVVFALLLIVGFVIGMVRGKRSEDD